MLVVIASILVVGLVMVSYLMLAPLILEVDSILGIYEARIHKLAAAGIGVQEGLPVFYVRAFWWERRFALYDLFIGNTSREPVSRKKKSSRKPASIGRIIRKVWATMKSFTVKRCHIDVDLGSMHINGMLYPAARMLSGRLKMPIAINFENRQIIQLRIENNLARMAWIYLNK